MYARPPCKFFWSLGVRFFSPACPRCKQGGIMTLHPRALRTYTDAPNAARLQQICSGHTSAHFTGNPESMQEMKR